MSYERVLKALVNLGLLRKDAEIYVHLATEGPQESANIAKNLKLSRQQVGSSLLEMQGRKIVFPIPERITKFAAVPFEKTIMLLMKAEREEAERLEQSKTAILNEWRLLTRQNNERKTTRANF